MKIELFGDNLVEIEFASPSELPVIVEGEEAETCRIFIKFPSGKTVELSARAYKQTADVFEHCDIEFGNKIDLKLNPHRRSSQTLLDVEKISFAD